MSAVHRPGAVGRWGAVRRVRDPLAAALAAATLVAALGVTDPYRPGGHPVCPVLALTGFYCAGCGAQRAVHDLAHLDLSAAWGMNPLVVLAVPLAVLLWVRWVRRASSRPATALAPAAPQAPAPAPAARAALPADG